MGKIKISEKKSHDLLQSVTKCLSHHNLSVSLTMKAISSADKANIISLLLLDHSRKVESITGLGKLIVGRIFGMDIENYKGGRSSKLSLTN